MQIRALSIEDAYTVRPIGHDDPRGTYLEQYRFDKLAEVVGHPLELAQWNVAECNRGAMRGIHFADVPPGQGKYITCMRGAGLDVVVDLRVGSPTFGRHECIGLDDRAHRAVYLGEGLGHAFVATEPHTVLTYLCSAVYSPEHEHAVHPLDPALGIRWPVDDLLLSPRDAAAPSLAEAAGAGLLPDFAACREYRDRLCAAAGRVRAAVTGA